MTIFATCPECDSSYQVKNSLRGKRIRCRNCQAAVLVADISAVETDPNLDIHEETQDELPLSRWSYREEIDPPAVPLSRQIILTTARNPWVGMGLVLGLWGLFSLLEPKFVLVMNVILLSLCGIGSLTGIVLERLQIPYENPFDLLHRATLGGLAARWASGWYGATAQEPADGKGRMTQQFGILLALLLGHAIILWILRQQQVLS